MTPAQYQLEVIVYIQFSGIPDNQYMKILSVSDESVP